MLIGENIKRLRESRGLTQSQFGAIAGVSDKAVSTWESGTREPRMGAIEKISLYFGIPKSDILFGGDEFAERTAVPKDDGLSPLEAQLMEYIRRLTDDQKKMLLAQIELLLSKQGSRPDSRE